LPVCCGWRLSRTPLRAVVWSVVLGSNWGCDIEQAEWGCRIVGAGGRLEYGGMGGGGGFLSPGAGFGLGARRNVRERGGLWAERWGYLQGIHRDFVESRPFQRP
jgi:hypothetical protein